MRNRRALSTVVGMVFAIIALTTTVTYITYSMNTLSQYNQSVLQKNQQNLDVGKEKFQISSVTFAKNNFNITVTNTGNLPINFTKLWFQNMSDTDRYKGFVPTSNIVGAGQTITNIGQSFKDISKISIDQADPYNLKLVTSRGNAQQFTLNSASTAPLNIQLLALPATVAGGFKTELVMVVTNNGSSMLTNIAPSALPTTNPGLIYTGSGTTLCQASAVSPANYNILAPGSTAIFKWDVTASGQGGDTCTYTITTPLQNGYQQTVSTKITVTTVSLTSTSYAANAGILTLNYTSFRWAGATQGTTWNSGWSWLHGQTTAFRLNMTNNNATQSVKFYLSKNTLILFYSTHISPSQQPTPFYLVNSTNPATMGSTVYSNCNGQSDYCLSVPPQGTITLYFASATVGGTGAQSFSNADIDTAFLLMFGKFTATQNGSGPLYAQNIPYISAVVT
jgi:hypothetical protein